MKLKTAATLVAIAGLFIGTLLMLYAKHLMMSEINYTTFLNIEAAFEAAAVVMVECAASAISLRFIKFEKA